MRAQRSDDNPFPRWLAQSRMSIREAAQALGASTSGIQAWKRVTPPRYVLLACAALSNGQAPIR